MWLFFTISACLVLAIVNILDKFIVTKTIKPVLFVFYSTILALPIFLAVPFGVQFLQTPIDWLITIISGLTFGVALWFMYSGFQHSEISHSGPLGGAAIALFVFILGQVFLNEPITPSQSVGIFLLIFGSLLISFEKSKKYQGWHIGLLYAVIGGLFFAVSNISAKYIYNHYDFYSGFVWTRGSTGLIGLITLAMPAVYKNLFGKKNQTIAAVNKQNISLVAVNKTLGIIGVLLLQYATAVGSVSMAFPCRRTVTVSVNDKISFNLCVIRTMVFPFSLSTFKRLKNTSTS
jgi:drug/metabolite transporter (DMT)-like permease